VQVTDPMTGWTGSVREVVLDIRRSGMQLEVDVELSADAAWDTVGDREFVMSGVRVQAVQ